MRRILVLLGVVCLILFVTGCGEPEATAPSTSAPRSTASPETTSTPSTATHVPTPATPGSRSLSNCRYAFPIDPASAATYAESHHDYPATDIQAPLGTRVVSPVDGVVDFVSRDDKWDGSTDDPAERGGLSFSVIGDDGIRYYGSHLKDIEPSVEVGERVAASKLVGHVGTSGNARGTDPHLHFGISRPTAPDDWRVRRGEVNPYEYLNAWKQGRALTPDVPGARSPSCRRMR